MDFVKDLCASFKKPPDTTLRWISPFESGLPYEHAIASPLFEVTAVQLSLHQWEWGEDCLTHSPSVEVYGYIKIIDDLGNDFLVFHRELVDSKPVKLLENKTTILRRSELEMPRCLSSLFLLEVHLKLKVDHHEQIVEIDHSEFLDFRKMVFYEVKQIVTIPNHCFSIDVEYRVFPCAMLACVGVVVEKIRVEDGGGDSDSPNAMLSGRISASYKLSTGLYMFHELVGDELELVIGDFTMLSTFAVPAYAALTIGLDVEVNNEKIVTDNALTFDTHSIWRWWFEKQIKGDQYLIRLIMSWGHAIKVLPENRLRECNEVDTSSRNIIQIPCKKRSRISQSKVQKSNQPINIQPFNIQPHWIVSDDPIELVEIFSISVCLIDRDNPVMNIKGEILGYDMLNKLNLFKSCDLSHGGTVQLADIHHCFRGSSFGLTTDLKDDQGLEISKGFAAYNFHLITDWYNRRICSIIRGLHGYASLHYTIFQDAVQAKLKLEFMGGGPGGGGFGYAVHGKIRAMYSNFRYSTQYEKKYYKSTLFERHESNAMEMELACSDIPLSKSAIAVPLNASLLVVGKIHVLLRGRFAETLLFKRVFKPLKPKEKNFVRSQKVEVLGKFSSLTSYVVWVYGTRL